MEYVTFNGIPLISYGLIGATTAFLTYSVFSDDAKTEPLPPKTLTQQIQSIMPTTEQSSEPEDLPEEPKSEQSFIPAAISDYLPSTSEESSNTAENLPEPTKGGKRKRTKRNKAKKRKTKRNLFFVKKN